MKNIYKNLYSDQNNSGELGESWRIEIMLSLVDGMNLRAKNILDIGCHDGTFLSLVKNRQNNFYGLEASNWGFEKSQQKGIKVTKYFFNDVDKLPYLDNFFDVVVAGEIIEHIYNTDFFLREISRVLKPSGKLILSTPNIASLGRRLFLFLGKNPILEITPNESGSVGHIRYFTSQSLNILLKKQHFKTLKILSDHVNLSGNGRIKSKILAKLFPKLGASIIVLAENGRW